MSLWEKFKDAIAVQPQTSLKITNTLKPTSIITVPGNAKGARLAKGGVPRSYCQKYKVDYEVPDTLESISNPRFAFDQKMPVVKITTTDPGRFVLNDEKSMEQAVADILTINGYILQAKKIAPKMFANIINKDYLHFAPQKAVSTDQYGRIEYDLEYCWIKFNPLTPTGKPAKYPYILNYQESCNLPYIEATVSTFGEIHYTQNGDVGKIKIVEWKNKVSYVIICSVVDQVLQVSKIEKHDFGGLPIELFKL